MSKKKDTININLSAEELASLVNTLAIAKAIFENSAEISYNNGDQDTYDKFTHRADICDLFIEKLVKNIDIGEPASDTHH